MCHVLDAINVSFRALDGASDDDEDLNLFQ